MLIYPAAMNIDSRALTLTRDLQGWKNLVEQGISITEKLPILFHML